jgi:hypothetical protein
METAKVKVIWEVEDFLGGRVLANFFEQADAIAYSRALNAAVGALGWGGISVMRSLLIGGRVV